jgi:HPr kinase/phosphorylase
MSTLCLHATCISLNGTGVLIRGGSGSGKSSLALQLLETAGTGLTGEVIKVDLVSDDQTELVVQNGKVYASPPHAIAGLLEIRGQMITRLDFVRDVHVVLVVDLKSANRIERLPEASDMVAEILGVPLACVAIDAEHPSAAARLRVAWAGCKKPSALTLARQDFPA